MKLGISFSIDVTKIDKSRLVQGKKGTYLDLTTFIEVDEQDQYGNNGFVSQSMTKEERESGAEKTAILGNSKVFYKGASDEARQHDNAQGMAQAKAVMEPIAEDDIPF